MSEMLLGNHFSHDIQKVIAISIMAAISNPAIHGVWLLAGRSIQGISSRKILF
jgi:hypothetical protein